MNSIEWTKTKAKKSSQARAATKPAPSRRRSEARAEVTVGSFMTRSPHSIGLEQTLETAHEMMRKHKIRHLPVLEGGRLLGLVSQRDLYLVETLRDVEPARVTVEDAMSSSVYQVAPDAHLGEVAQEMFEHKYGCAIVMQGNKPVGIFTTVDALKALAAVLRGTGN